MNLKNKKISDIFFLAYFFILILIAIIFFAVYLSKPKEVKPVEIDVVSYKETEVDRVEIEQREVIVLVDGTVQLHTTVFPDNANNKTLRWATSDDTIVTVSDHGVIHAVGPGTATVSVVTTNGKTDSCNIIVREEEKTIPKVEKIVLEKSRLCLWVGDTSYLKYATYPKEAPTDVEWSSSDPETISISEVGEIKALKAGTAIVTIKESNGKSTTCEVRAYDKMAYRIPVAALTINKSAATLGEGETLQLTATVSPTNAYDQTITWASYDPNIATVSDKGLVKAIKSGRTIITAKSNNGVTVSCEVQVDTVHKDNRVSIESLSLSSSTVQIEKGETIPLEVTYNPTNATNLSVMWGTSDSSIVSVTQEGKIKGVNPGTATVAVFSDNGKMAATQVTVTGDATVAKVPSAEDVYKKISTGNIEKAQVAVFANGKIQSKYAYQTDDDERFKISSASKSVLGIIAAKMDADGIVNLDTNIDTYWHMNYDRNFSECTEAWKSNIGSNDSFKKYTAPSVKLVENPATLRNCLTHSSTVKNLSMIYMEPGNTSSEYFGGGLSKTYARAAFMLSHTSHQLFDKGGIPGTSTSYQMLKDNTTRDHAMAGFTMQVSMKETINEYLAREILTPLGCTNPSGFSGGNSIYFATSYNTSAVDLAKMISAIANDGVYEGKEIFSKDAITDLEKVESKLENQTIAFDYVDQKYVKYGSFSSINNATYYKIGDVVSDYVSYITYDPKTSVGFVVTIKYKSKDSQAYNILRTAAQDFYSKSS